MTGQVVPDEMMIVMAPRNDDVYNSVSFHSQVCSNCQSRPPPPDLSPDMKGWCCTDTDADGGKLCRHTGHKSIPLHWNIYVSNF